ncbi:MAG: DUF3127 domain-containing protein [Pseudomonadota bacterium]
MAYELTGKIKLIQEPKTFDSGFTKREMMVIVEDGRYPQEINLEFVQDKGALLDPLQPGQEVTVGFNKRTLRTEKPGLAAGNQTGRS